MYIQDKKTFKKPFRILAFFAILLVMLYLIPAIEVHAAYSDFDLNGAPLTSAGGLGYSYTYDDATKILTITGDMTGSIAYNSSTGTGHVILEDGVSVTGDISVNGNVRLKSGATVNGNITTSDNVLVEHNATVNGNVTTEGKVNITSGTVNGTTTSDGLAITGSGRVNNVVLTTGADIDDTNVVAVGYSFPHSAVNDGAGNLGSISVTGGEIVVTGPVQNKIILFSKTDNSAYNVNVQNAGAINGGLIIDNLAAIVTVSGSISGGIQVRGQNADLSLIGNVSGDIVVDVVSSDVDISYRDGTLTGNIINNSPLGDVVIGTNTIDGSISASGNIDIQGGTVNSNVTSTGGIITMFIGSEVLGTITGNLVRYSTITFTENSGLFDTLVYDRYYPVDSITGALGTMQTTAPAGGYIHLTTGGSGDILTMNNVNLAPARNSIRSLNPLNIHLQGTNTVYDVIASDSVTITADVNGVLNLGYFTMAGETLSINSGTVNAVARENTSAAVTAGAINIHAGTITSQSQSPQSAFSVKPTISAPAGTTLQIMAGAAAPGTVMEESADYHLNQYASVSISVPFTPVPTPTPGTGTTETNPALSPETGVYTN